MDIRSRYTLHTAENVDLDVELAGVANRVFAYLIDALIMLLAFIMCTLMTGLISQTNKELSETLMPLLSFGILFGYHFLLEWLWNGRTVGKAVFHIRVVRNNGQAIGFWESFGRNLLRLVDVFLSGLGIMVMVFSKREKRLGDYLAGTLVINSESDNPAPGMSRSFLRPVQAGESDHVPVMTPTPEEYQLLRSFLQRRKGLFAQSREQLDTELRAHFKTRYNLPDETVNEPSFLETLYEEFRR